MEDLVSKILPPLLVAFVVSASLAYFSRKAKEEFADGKLEYGPEVKVVGWVSAAIATGTALAMVLVDHGGQYLSLGGIAALFGIIGLYLLLESYSTKGSFDMQQIRVSSIWSKPKQAQWRELTGAAFKKNGQYFELKFENGTKISLSKILRGSQAVCQHVESLGFATQDTEKVDPA